MKTAVTVLIILCMATVAGAQYTLVPQHFIIIPKYVAIDENRLTAESLKGKVKQFVETEEIMDSDNHVAYTASRRLLAYNQQGFNVLCISTAGIYDSIIKKYNGQNLIAESNPYGRTTGLSEQTEYIYDGKGELAKKTFLALHAPQSGKSITIFDDNGNEIKTERYDSSGNLQKLWLNTYAYGEGGVITKKTVLTFHKIKADAAAWKSQLVTGRLNNEEIKILLPEGWQIDTTIWNYHYDSNGDIPAVERFDNGVLNSTQSYKYNHKNRPIEWNYYQSSRGVRLKLKVSYDKHGSVIQGKSYDTGKLYTKITSKYQYDKMGNWTKRTDTVNSKPVAIVTRKIQYY